MNAPPPDLRPQLIGTLRSLGDAALISGIFVNQKANPDNHAPI
jgi:hypothetical protein